MRFMNCSSRYSGSQSAMTRISTLVTTSVLGLALVLGLSFGAGSIPWSQQQPRAAADVHVSIEQFVRYIEDWSEPEGYFDTDNFISNETSYLHVVDQLRQRVKPGGIYLGVGPDQNFSYIVHTRPVLAVVTDIRRQNMLQHLWFKALFALSSTRAEYLAMMVSRQPPAVKPNATLEDILAAVRRANTNEGLFRKNVNAVTRLLVDTYKLKLSAEDLAKIEYVFETFWREHLDLRFSSIGRGNAMNYPTFEEMLLETDRQGRRQNYLSSEELFQWLKKFQSENRVIPIVGDFAGPKALKTVGSFLKTNGLQVSAFYTSNVEYYLFGGSGWGRYMANLRALPTSSDSLFIRSYFRNGPPHPMNMPGHRPTSIVSPMTRLLNERLSSYWDVVKP
jgi:hypothetical protein